MVVSNNEVIRCDWVTNDPLYIEYHDKEWGKPEKCSKKLFEMLCLEGQQAGLSWITILKKRQNYRNIFWEFDPYKIINLSDVDVTNLLKDTNIVRHRGKILAIINNAQCFIDMENKGIPFSEFIWNFVNNEPIVNNWTSSKEVPSDTDISKNLSKTLKKYGFKYVMRLCKHVD